MPAIRALVTINMLSGLPEDAVTNSLYFSAPLTATTTELNGITAALTTFYQSFDQYMSPKVAPSAKVRYYNMNDPEPRAPLREDTITLTIPAGTGLPEELALCLSFQGEKVSGANQARRRGRIYLGPWQDTIRGSSTASNRPLSTALTTIANNATALASTAFGAGTPWVVWSPTNNSFTNVTDGWLDDAFDTQRRRGVAPTSRTLWT